MPLDRGAAWTRVGGRCAGWPVRLGGTGVSLRGVARPLSLEQFLRDRVDEDVLTARLNDTVPLERAQAVTEALDRWELLELASTAQREGRPDFAASIRRGLAANYAAHPDLRAEWLPTEHGK
jgi:hypothetical protein